MDTNYCKSLSPDLRLAITLRHLAAGDSYRSLMYGFRVAHNSIVPIVPQVCEAIVAEFGPELLSCPQTEEGWLSVAKDFSDKWQLHHCLGALDGKHVAINCPPDRGSLYYNYKGFHSIILMALVDANYKFLWVEVGAHGSAGDAHIFNNGELKEAIDSQAIHFPPPEPLPHDDKDMPYFIVGDDAFALRSWLQKPFSNRQLTMKQRVFNYQLSRARRVVENAFWILSNRFRCMQRTLQQRPKVVGSMVLACICLHNLLRERRPNDIRQEADQEDEDHNIVPGAWRQNTPLEGGASEFGNHTCTKAAKKQRDYLCEYYSSDVGAVPWQEDMI